MIAPSALAFLADERNPDTLKGLIDDAGPIAGLFVLALGIAIFFLWRSMSRQMKKIDPTLPDGPDDAEQARDRRYTEQAQERGRASLRDADEPPDA